MAPAPSLQELIDTVARDTGSTDLLDQLGTAAAIATRLEEVGDALLGHFVDQCRRSGRSWTEISGALGVSKQAAHKRFTATTSPLLDRFTERARHALDAAHQAARDMGHPYTGTEHLLIGLLSEPEGIAARILAEGNMTDETVRPAVEAIIPRGPATVLTVLIPLTPRAAKVLEAAMAEALAMGHNYIGTEHILLALFQEPDGVAAKVLGLFRMTAPAVHKRVIELLSGYQAAAGLRP